MLNPILTLIIFGLLFGPKIGPVDLSILIPAASLPLLLSGTFAMDRYFLKLAFLMVPLLALQFLVQILADNSDPESLGRLLRVAFTAVLVGAMIGTPRLNSSRTLLRCLTLAIIIHSLIVIVAGLFHPLSELLSIVSGNDRIKPYRASGLLSGFDMVGLVNIVGMVTIYSGLASSSSRIRDALSVAILFLSCCFTSRVSMAISAFIFFLYSFKFLSTRTIPIFLRTIVGTLLVFVLSIIATYFIIVLSVTLDLNLFVVDSSIIESIRSRHAAENLDDLYWATMWKFPRDELRLLFGNGSDDLTSDIGYVKEISRYGLFGLSYTLLFHFFILNTGSPKRKLRSTNQRTHRRITCLIFLLMLVLTLKNNYLLVRCIFPLFLLIACAPRADKPSDLSRSNLTQFRQP